MRLMIAAGTLAAQNPPVRKVTPDSTSGTGSSTDSDGKLTISNITCGPVIFTAEKDGYIQNSYGRAPSANPRQSHKCGQCDPLRRMAGGRQTWGNGTADSYGLYRIGGLAGTGGPTQTAARTFRDSPTCATQKHPNQERQNRLRTIITGAPAILRVASDIKPIAARPATNILTLATIRIWGDSSDAKFLTCAAAITPPTGSTACRAATSPLR